MLGSQDGIKTLNEQWKDKKTQALFDHTKKSLAANSDLAASKSIPAYGWTERDQKLRDAKRPSERESTDESSLALTDEDISQALADFQKTHPFIKLETQDNNRIIAVSSPSVPCACSANILRRLTSCLGASSFDSVSRSIAMRIRSTSSALSAMAIVNHGCH